MKKNKTAGKKTQKHKHIRLTGFHLRILGLVILPMLILGIVITLISSQRLNQLAMDELEKNLYTYAQSTIIRYDMLNEFPYTYDESKGFLKGYVHMENQQATMDSLKESTGMDITYYFGDVKVLSTLKNNDGIRELGTTFEDPDIYSRVMETGENIFVTDLNLYGEECCGYYSPLYQVGSVNSTEIIGIVLASTSRAEVDATISQSVLLFTIILIAALAICSILASLIVRRMSGALSYSTSEIQKLADGQLHFVANKKNLKRGDEIGDVAKATQQVVDALTGIVKNITGTSNTLADISENFIDAFHNINQNISHIDTAVEGIANGATS